MGGFPSHGEVSRASKLREEENPLLYDNKEEMLEIGGG